MLGDRCVVDLVSLGDWFAVGLMIKGFLLVDLLLIGLMVVIVLGFE
jgi:hypothetical protein